MKEEKKKLLAELELADLTVLHGQGDASRKQEVEAARRLAAEIRDDLAIITFREEKVSEGKRAKRILAAAGIGCRIKNSSSAFGQLQPNNLLVAQKDLERARELLEAGNVAHVKVMSDIDKDHPITPEILEELAKGDAK